MIPELLIKSIASYTNDNDIIKLNEIFDASVKFELNGFYPYKKYKELIDDYIVNNYETLKEWGIKVLNSFIYCEEHLHLHPFEYNNTEFLEDFHNCTPHNYDPNNILHKRNYDVINDFLKDYVEDQYNTTFRYKHRESDNAEILKLYALGIINNDNISRKNKTKYFPKYTIDDINHSREEELYILKGEGYDTSSTENVKWWYYLPHFEGQEGNKYGKLVKISYPSICIKGEHEPTFIYENYNIYMLKTDESDIVICQTCSLTLDVLKILDEHPTIIMDIVSNDCFNSWETIKNYTLKRIEEHKKYKKDWENKNKTQKTNE